MKLITSAATAALACALGATATAQDAARAPRSVPADHPLRTLRDLAADADLVFRGTVQDIAYRLSIPMGSGQRVLPYTFVTYRVLEVYRGEHPGASLTLRFLGGLDQSTLQYVTASTVPEFDTGEQDILFVIGNGERISPIVGDRRGRLRVAGDQVYTDTGRQLTIGSDVAGRLRVGPRFDLPGLATTTVRGLIDVDGKAVPYASDFTTDLGPNVQPLPSNAISVQEFGIRLRNAMIDLPAPARRFASTDPRKPFAGVDLSEVAAPVAAQRVEAEPADEAAERAADHRRLGPDGREIPLPRKSDEKRTTPDGVRDPGAAGKGDAGTPARVEGGK